jgi:hypothetical protein
MFEDAALGLGFRETRDWNLLSSHAFEGFRNDGRRTTMSFGTPSITAEERAMKKMSDDDEAISKNKRSYIICIAVRDKLHTTLHTCTFIA